MLIFRPHAAASFCLPLSNSYQIHGDDPVGSASRLALHEPASSKANFVVPRVVGQSYSPVVVSSSNAKRVEPRARDPDARIGELCDAGDLEKAMKLLCLSGKVDVSSKTYCSILQLCADLKSLDAGNEVHSLIRDYRIVIDKGLGSKLVYMYATCGDLRRARRLLEEMSTDNAFLWNLLINAYGKAGDFPESIRLFRHMLESGVQADSYTFSSVLKILACFESANGGEQLHAYALKSGFGDHIWVANSLICLYFRNQRVRSAVNLFDGMSDRDVVSWNSMINGYVTNDNAEDGLQLFEQMLLSGIRADLATIISVISCCADCNALSTGRVIHGFAVKSKCAGETRFCNALLDMYAKCGDLASAVRAFDRINQKSVVTWTSMLAGYAREGLASESVRLFRDMESKGIEPDVYTITAVLKSCALNDLLQVGREVHDWIRENGMESDLYVSNALMDMYAKCGSMEDARLVFSQMPVKDVVSWNTMIGGYSKNSLANETLELFPAMLKECNPDGRTMACILPACASIAALDRGREIHGYILRSGYFSDRHVANALVDMYVKCGALLQAHSLFDMMVSKDLVSWTVMIAGYGMHGFGAEAIALFTEMRRMGIDPDAVSFISILYSCSHSGLLDEGWRFFNIMKNECKIEPELEHYACMVDLLARTGKLRKAYRFIETMPISPDTTIWGTLLCGCRIHQDVELAERVAERVFELEPENTGYYVLMANIYAEAEKWEEVKKLRQKIGQKGPRKNRGCSWIEIRGKTEIFFTGDQSHPLMGKIESLLKRLQARMKEEGLFPVTRFALIDADEVEKEAALCGHSEKLAMALGLLSSGAGKTIRVTKNLRVCGDCHETAKFISRTTEREILLRDSKRFHHFKDGRCSCRGFW